MELVTRPETISSGGTSINKIRKGGGGGGKKGGGKRGRGAKPDTLIYATFTTPPNSIGASAVCAFRSVSENNISLSLTI